MFALGKKELMGAALGFSAGAGALSGRGAPESAPGSPAVDRPSAVASIDEGLRSYHEKIAEIIKRDQAEHLDARQTLSEQREQMRMVRNCAVAAESRCEEFDRRIEEATAIADRQGVKIAEREGAVRQISTQLTQRGTEIAQTSAACTRARDTADAERTRIPALETRVASLQNEASSLPSKIDYLERRRRDLAERVSDLEKAEDSRRSQGPREPR